MYPVTTEFQNKIKAPIRRIFGKVQIDYTDPFLDQSIVVSASENANISYPKQTADSILNPIGKVASLDGVWVLDGSYAFAPSTENDGQMGWWGSQLSGVGGLFTAPYPTLTVEFISRPISELRVVGDRARAEHPVDFTINLYNNENTLLYSFQMAGNNSVEWKFTLIQPITQVTKMVLEITKWSHESRQVKILEFFTSIQEIYEGDDIFSINLLEEMEVNNGSLPVGTISSNELSIKLYNKNRKFDAGNVYSPLYNLLKINRKIKAYLGIEREDKSKEMVPLGTFWSGDWVVPENDIYASTFGWDRLKFLTEIDYTTNSVRQDISLYDLALEVLTMAGLKDGEFWIDEELKEYILPYLYIEGKSSREVLRLIAEAVLGHVYCDRYGIIRVEGTKQIIELYEVTASDNANISYLNQVTDKIEMPDGLYASLDGSWVLDGSFLLAPVTDTLQMGWWGEQLSDVEGNFIEPYPKLTLTFLGKAIEAVRVVGDSLRGEYPFDFTITVYDSSNNLLSQQIIQGNSDMSKVVSIPENPTNATKIELTISRWSHPHRQAKIVEFRDIPYILEITPDDYYSKNNPARYSEVSNVIEVITQPIQPDKLQEVYKSDEADYIEVGQTKTITAFYNSSPCIDAIATIEGTGSIESVTYYPWGADVKVFSDTAGSFSIVVNAKPLIIKNSKKIVIRDENSIVENGLKKFTLKDNPLIQTEDMATEISIRLLENYKEPRRNLNLDWRGNPALMLGNEITVIDTLENNNYKVIRQTLDYDGGLRCNLDARKVVE